MRIVFTKQDIAILLLTLVATVACLQHGLHDLTHSFLHDAASCSHPQELASHSHLDQSCTGPISRKQLRAAEKTRLFSNNLSGSIDLPGSSGHDPLSCSICHFLAMAQSPFQTSCEVPFDFTLSLLVTISVDTIPNRELIIDSIRGPPLS